MIEFIIYLIIGTIVGYLAAFVIGIIKYKKIKGKISLLEFIKIKGLEIGEFAFYAIFCAVPCSILVGGVLSILARNIFDFTYTPDESFVYFIIIYLVVYIIFIVFIARDLERG